MHYHGSLSTSENRGDGRARNIRQSAVAAAVGAIAMWRRRRESLQRQLISGFFFWQKLTGWIEIKLLKKYTVHEEGNQSWYDRLFVVRTQHLRNQITMIIWLCLCSNTTTAKRNLVSVTRLTRKLAMFEIFFCKLILFLCCLVMFSYSSLGTFCDICSCDRGGIIADNIKFIYLAQSLQAWRHGDNAFYTLFGANAVSPPKSA